MVSLSLLFALTATLLCTALPSTVLAQWTISNKVLSVGITGQHGSAIDFLVDLNSPRRNLINTHDEGRECQMSFYSGPDPYHGCHWSGQSWSWNPIQAGDAFGNKGKILHVEHTASSLYVKSIPLQWACDNVPCNCTFEQWLSFDPAHENVVIVRNRINMFRADKTHYGGHDQELPALYGLGSNSELWSSRNGTLVKLSYPVPGPPWGHYEGLDNWAAFAMPESENPQRYALGIMNENTTTFLAGFHGTPSSGATTHDDATGYIAPISDWALEWNTTREYCFALGVGYLEDVKSTFEQMKRTGLKC